KAAYATTTKPFDTAALSHRLEKALEVSRLRRELEQLRNQVQGRYKFDDIIAASEQMQGVLHQVVQIAATDSTVCIYGESGTGKELVAKELHVASRRAIGPLVAIYCAAIPQGLVQN